MLSPTGEQVDLVCGDLTATVTEVGAALRTLRMGDRDLVRGFAADQVAPVYSGAVLAPWPNRVRDGRYRFAGEEHQLPLNEPERGTALHGLAIWQPWSLLDRTPGSVRWGLRIFPRPGYPFHLDLEMHYRLDDEGLLLTLEAVNRGVGPAPYGCSIHPYLVAGPGRVDDWTLQLPATTLLDVDADRLLPLGRRPAADLDLDFTTPRRIGSAFADHAFTDVTRSAGGVATARLLADDGGGVAMSWGPECPWVQVHTGDRPEPELHRTGLAVEPMTCPPDALASGEDLVVLEPGDRHTAWWRISPVAPR